MEHVGSSARFSRGALLYALAIFLISLNQATSKFLVESLNTFVVMQIRMFVTASICIYSLRNEKYGIIGPPEHRKLLFTRGILGFLGLCCTYYALKFLSLPDKAALAFLVPLFTTISAHFLIGESLPLRKILSCLISLAGVVMIARPAFIFGRITEEHRFGAVIASLAFVVVTGFGLIILRKIRDVHPAVPVANFAFTSLICATVINFIGGDEYPKTLNSWFCLILTGILGFAIQFLETKALQYSPASVLVNIRYTQLIWAALGEWLIWGDFPDIWTILGSFIVIGSVSYCCVESKHEPLDDEEVHA